jgi:hypothetical protein
VGELLGSFRHGGSVSIVLLLLVLFCCGLILLVSSRVESFGGDRTCERLGEDLPMLNDSDS